MMDNMEMWNKVKQPPLKALKKIKGGRIGGMTDINPQWRMQAMTEAFGPIGFGWTYKIVRLWTENGDNGQVCAFSEIEMSINVEDNWSVPFSGIGGSMLVVNESKGPHTSDEAYKMATTDALSVAMKQLGVAADIYLGNFDGSKYLVPSEPPKPIPPRKRKYADTDEGVITDGDVQVLCIKLKENKRDETKFKAWLVKEYQLDSRKKIPKMLYDEICAIVEAK
jgi:hypothetical protein